MNKKTGVQILRLSKLCEVEYISLAKEDPGVSMRRGKGHSLGNFSLSCHLPDRYIRYLCKLLVRTQYGCTNRFS